MPLIRPADCRKLRTGSETLFSICPECPPFRVVSVTFVVVGVV